MDFFDALRLQLEWGADEALLEAPQDRFSATPPAPAPQAAPPVAARPRAAPAMLAGLPVGPAEAEKIAAGCASLAQLRAALENFTGCGLRDTATQLVFADGAEETNLMLVGDAPGAEEDRSGKPFAGPAGQLLDKMLASIGFDRTRLRIANVVPWRPPGDRPPSESEIALCLPFLHRHIALVRPAALLLLGAVAAKALLPAPSRNSGIRKLRGQWQQVVLPCMDTPIACLPTYHPAYLARMPSAKRESWHDFIALRQWSSNLENRL